MIFMLQVQVILDHNWPLLRDSLKKGRPLLDNEEDHFASLVHISAMCMGLGLLSINQLIYLCN